MANIVITKSGSSSIVVDFGAYAGALGITKASFHVNDLTDVELRSSHVFVYMSATRKEWPLTFDSAYAGNDYYIVDTVAGAAPSSESDLFDKITALRG